MDTVQEPSATAGIGSQMHWHFRAMPPEVQRGAIRRLALSGLDELDIAVRTGWSVDGVRRALLEDECVRRLSPGYGDPRRLQPSPNGSFAI
jgi:hypothetical protein